MEKCKAGASGLELELIAVDYLHPPVVEAHDVEVEIDAHDTLSFPRGRGVDIHVAGATRAKPSVQSARFLTAMIFDGSTLTRSSPGTPLRLP